VAVTKAATPRHVSALRFPTFPKHCHPFSSPHVFVGCNFIHEFRSPFTEEIAMQNVITIGRELVPVEQIAYVETFEPALNGQRKSEKAYKNRVVLLMADI